MPATTCSAGPRRRPRCAAPPRARRAPAAVDERDRLTHRRFPIPARRRADRRSRAGAGFDRRGAAPGAVAAATPDRPGRSARSAARTARSPSNPSATAASTVSIARAAGCSASGTPDGGVTTGTPAAVRARDSAAPLCRTERTITAICDHGTSSTRWALPQRVDDQRRFGVRRRGHPHGHRTRVLARCRPVRGPVPAPGSRRAIAGDGPRDRGCAAVRLRQRDHRIVLVAVQQRGIGAAVGEHRLVGVTGDDGQLGARRQHPHQAGGLRVEVLGVVDEQQLDPRALGGEQLGVDGERLQCGADEFGSAERGHGGLRRGHPDGGPQQHRLLVLLRELARRPATPDGRTAGRCVAAQRDPRRVRCSGPTGRAARWRTRRCSAQAAAGGARRRRRWSPSSRSPASSSRMMPSCSAVVISRGGGSPLRWAASLSTAKAYECTVRTSGSRTTARLPACSRAEVIAARACVPSRAEPVSSRTDSGSAPSAMWAAAVSISARVLPVPGPPSTPHHTANTGFGQRRRWRST